MRISCPARASFIRTGAQPNSMSSGWAPTARIFTRLGLGDGEGFDLVALLDGVDDVFAAGHLTEDGVLVIEIGAVDVGDEELAAVGAGSGVGHGDDSRLVALVGAAFDFVFEAVAGTAAAGAFGAAALDHEVGDYTVEIQAVLLEAK